MALYRNIQMAFWTDTSVADDYTPDDRLMYLYLLTNPHTNLCGCYEISMTQIANETGFERNKVVRLIEKAERTHGTVSYSKDTKELIVLRWSKYNWTGSEKFRKPLLNEIQAVKCPVFKDFLIDLFEGNDNPTYRIDTVSPKSAYGTDTTVTVTDTVTDTNTDKTTNSHKQSKAIIYYPNDDKLDEAFRDYVDMRKAIKAPMTDRAITLAMSKLEKLATVRGAMDNDKAIQILEQSTMNSWKGLFELKSGKKSTGDVFDEWRNA